MNGWLTPSGYDALHWAVIVAFTYVVWAFCGFIRGRLKI